MSIVLNRAAVNIDLIFDHQCGQFLEQMEGWNMVARVPSGLDNFKEKKEYGVKGAYLG